MLLVLCVQLLPLKQTITWLLGGQATEELVHADDAGKSNKDPDGLCKEYLPVYYPTLIEGLSLFSLTRLHDLSVGLPARHADDIPTPPPNC